eukprot:TRINITY_DN3437_c0_g1_i1.p1 TRINITY_DN3437_c0_g1~~TRINITY_DN3437_c0_g1_i1.p1  ORF type:complete len:533 (-),score=139.26 TRINITY_DN3437_c0_g1_i1:176-1774(-)
MGGHLQAGAVGERAAETLEQPALTGEPAVESRPDTTDAGAAAPDRKPSVSAGAEEETPRRRSRSQANADGTPPSSPRPVSEVRPPPAKAPRLSLTTGAVSVDARDAVEEEMVAAVVDEGKKTAEVEQQPAPAAKVPSVQEQEDEACRAFWEALSVEGTVDAKPTTKTLRRKHSEEFGFTQLLGEVLPCAAVDSCGLSASTSSRRVCFGSIREKSKTAPFAQKATKKEGDRVDPSDIGFGYSCRRGLKPRSSPNQDSWIAMRVDGDFSLYGVFDGHGVNGHEVSNYVKDNLPKLILRDTRFGKCRAQLGDVCRDAFARIQAMIAEADKRRKLDAKWSGTTATIAIHDHVANRLTVAHVADSSCALGRRMPGDAASEGELSCQVVEGVQLTRDHKPDLPEEKARIERAGGTVEWDGFCNHRVYAAGQGVPGLNMSRCLGDLMGHKVCGLSCEPEVVERDLEDDDHVLLLCSDGVWEFVKASEAVEIVSKFPPERAMHAADHLVSRSRDLWIQEEGGSVVDDITVVVAWLQPASS